MTEEHLARLRVVLVGTTHPGNIGSAARAMKAMGITDLVLVAPETFPHADATALASGADDLLATARVMEDLPAALADCVWVVGTSARLRTHSVPVLGPDVAAERALQRSEAGPVALVFGREHSGLTNAELDRCNAFVQIPTVAHFSSLNLAGSVQVMTYALRMAALDGVSGEAASPRATERDPPATQAEMEGLFAHFEQTLTAIDVLDPGNPRHLMRRLRHLYLRTELSGSEVRMLRGILTHAERGR